MHFILARCQVEEKRVYVVTSVTARSMPLFCDGHLCLDLPTILLQVYGDVVNFQPTVFGYCCYDEIHGFGCH